MVWYSSSMSNCPRIFWSARLASSSRPWIMSQRGDSGMKMKPRNWITDGIPESPSIYLSTTSKIYYHLRNNSKNQSRNTLVTRLSNNITNQWRFCHKFLIIVSCGLKTSFTAHFNLSTKISPTNAGQVENKCWYAYCKGGNRYWIKQKTHTASAKG